VEHLFSLNVAFFKVGRPTPPVGTLAENRPAGLGSSIVTIAVLWPPLVALIHYPAIAALDCAILGTTPSSSVLCTMELADYLRDQAVMYRQLAERSDDPVVKNEMLELASICEEVANNIEDHLTGG
jgi:hypothetical protein